MAKIVKHIELMKEISERTGFVNKKNIGIVAGCLLTAAVVGIGTLSIDAQNKKSNKLSINVPSAGIALALDEYELNNETDKAQLTALITNKVAMPEETETTQPVIETTTQETEASEETTEAPKPTSIYDTIAISQVDNYVNVRATPSTDGQIVGKIFNNCAATIVETTGDWYHIISGNLTGYIKSEYFVTGEQAKNLAVQCGYVNATVTTQTLNVRENQSTDSKLLTQLPEGGVFDVNQYGDGWVNLNVDGDISGWVSMDYVNISVKYNTALTLEEEQAKIQEEKRLADEAAAAEKAAREAKAAEEAAKKKATSSSKNTTSSSSENKSSNSTAASDAAYDTSSAAATRKAVVAYALQYVGNPYVYGGSSLTNGTDCSGFTMSVYNKFGYGLSHSSSAQSGEGTSVSMDSLLPGDLLFYTNGGSSIGHVALYIGNGQVVHASTPSSGIKISDANYRTPLKAVRVIN